MATATPAQALSTTPTARAEKKTERETPNNAIPMKSILSSSRRPDITFHASGEIYITVRVARILNLDADSSINIAIDNGEYLLFAQHHLCIGSHTARCHPVNAGSRYFRANSVRLCRAMLKACGANIRAALMCGAPININQKTYIPIITRTTL